MADEGPRLEVRVGAVDAEHVLTGTAERRRSLAESLWLDAAPKAGDPAEHFDRLGAARRRPDPAWSQVTIPVRASA